MVSVIVMLHNDKTEKEDVVGIGLSEEDLKKLRDGKYLGRQRDKAIPNDLFIFFQSDDQGEVENAIENIASDLLKTKYGKENPPKIIRQSLN